MKTRTTRNVSCVAICAAMAMIVPEVQAQGSTFAVRQQHPSPRQPANRQATPHPSQNLNNLPTGPILPMTNPVAPMTSAPVQPFIRYGGIPTVVIPETRRDNSPSRDGRDARDGRDSDHRRGNRRDVPVVLGPVYLVDPFYYQAQPSAPAIPGQLPGVYHPDPAPIAVNSAPGAPPRTVTPAPAPESPLVYHSEPNVIITPPAPPLTVEPPPIGMLREDVLARYGRPWGTISTRGSETFYFDRGLVVVIREGRVAEIK